MTFHDWAGISLTAIQVWLTLFQLGITSYFAYKTYKISHRDLEPPNIDTREIKLFLEEELIRVDIDMKNIGGDGRLISPGARLKTANMDFRDDLKDVDPAKFACNKRNSVWRSGEELEISLFLEKEKLSRLSLFLIFENEGRVSIKNPESIVVDLPEELLDDSFFITFAKI